MEQFLRSLPNAEWVTITEAVAREAARPRVGYGLRTPDALIVATTLIGKATVLVTNLVTNDDNLRKVEQERLKVLV